MTHTIKFTAATSRGCSKRINGFADSHLGPPREDHKNPASCKDTRLQEGLLRVLCRSPDRCAGRDVPHPAALVPRGGDRLLAQADAELLAGELLLLAPRRAQVFLEHLASRPPCNLRAGRHDVPSVPAGTLPICVRARALNGWTLEAEQVGVQLRVLPLLADVRMVVVIVSLPLPLIPRGDLTPRVQERACPGGRELMAPTLFGRGL